MMCGVKILEPVTSHVVLCTKMAIKYTNKFYLEISSWSCEFYYEEVWGWMEKVIRWTLSSLQPKKIHPSHTTGDEYTSPLKRVLERILPHCGTIIPFCSEVPVNDTADGSALPLLFSVIESPPSWSCWTVSVLPPLQSTVYTVPAVVAPITIRL